jgi:integrase
LEAGEQVVTRTITAAAAVPLTSVREAIEAYLAEPRAAATTRAYTTTLSQLSEHVGPEQPLPTLTTDRLIAAIHLLWSTKAPATWNRHLAAVRSWLGWCRRNGLPMAVEALPADQLHNRYRPVDLADRPTVIAPADLARLWGRDDIPVRDRALWRLLYDSASRAGEALALNIEDLDLPQRHAHARAANGGAGRRLHFQTEAARLLQDVVAGRDRGPVFVGDRTPGPRRRPAPADVDPASGLARLSHPRAEAAFRRYSGWTFQQLRHSRLAHLGQAGCGVGVLLTLSGYKRPASVRPYVVDGRVDDTVIAALLLATDPARQPDQTGQPSPG